jgi:methylmalonyl-CoA mutase C-terminal domain/subunit
MSHTSEARKVRVLVGKPGLDGHDRGAKVVALALRDAGFEVIYTGLHQSVEAIVAAARDKSVDVIGLSIMSGAHLPICQKLVELCHGEGLDDVQLAVGGVIPRQDIEKLRQIGIHGVFPGGTPFEEITTWMTKATSKEV